MPRIILWIFCTLIVPTIGLADPPTDFEEYRAEWVQGNNPQANTPEGERILREMHRLRLARAANPSDQDAGAQIEREYGRLKLQFLGLPAPVPGLVDGTNPPPGGATGGNPPPGGNTPPGENPPGVPPGLGGDRVVRVPGATSGPEDARAQEMIAKAAAERELAPIPVKTHSTGKEAGREIAEIAQIKGEPKAQADVTMPSKVPQVPVTTFDDLIADRLPEWRNALLGQDLQKRQEVLEEIERLTASDPAFAKLVAETKQSVAPRPVEDEDPRNRWAPMVSTAKLDELKGELFVASKGSDAKEANSVVVGRAAKAIEAVAGEGNYQKEPAPSEGNGLKVAGISGGKITPVGNQPSRTLAALLARLRASNPPARGIASVPPSKQAAVSKVSGEPSPTVLARVKPLMLKKFFGKMAGISGPELASPTAMGRIALFNLGWFFLLSFLVMRVFRRIKARLSRRLPRPVVSAKPVTVALEKPALPAEPAKVTPPVQKHKGRPRERRRLLPNHDTHTIPASEGAQNPMDTALTVPKYSERRKEKIRAAAKLLKPRLESRAAKPITITEEKPEEKVAAAAEKTRIIA